LTFHDGTAFDSEAVVFSFKRQMDETSPFRFYPFPIFDNIFGNLKRVWSNGTHSVVFELEKPFFPFLAALTTSCASIVSPAAVKKYGAEFMAHPVGTGPYRMKSWERGKKLEMVHYPEYWRKEIDFRRCVFLIVPNFETLHQLFKDGKVDVLLSFSITRVTGIKRQSWVGIKRVPTLSVGFFAINPQNRFLKNKEFRQAIRHLWDPRILMYVYQEYMHPLHSMLPKGFSGYSGEAAHSFSVAAAKDLLEQNKFPDKIVLNFLVVAPGGLDLQMVSLFSKNLKKAGIELKINSVAENEYLQMVGRGEYDLTYSSWIADYPDPYSILSAMFDARLLKQGFANLAKFSDGPLQAATQKAAGEADTERREILYKNILRMIDGNVLCIPISQATKVAVFNKRKVSDVPISPLGIINLIDLKKK
jgi:peptide/nickel transport system substrate-binding protein